MNTCYNEQDTLKAPNRGPPWCNDFKIFPSRPNTYLDPPSIKIWKIATTTPPQPPHTHRHSAVYSSSNLFYKPLGPWHSYALAQYPILLIILFLKKMLVNFSYPLIKNDPYAYPLLLRHPPFI